jgi:hypothetical protein
MNTTEAAYVPGVCNINRAEIAYRRKAGHLGLALFIIILVPLVFTDVSRYYRAILFFPALLGAIGYLQARNKFCVAYAGAGQQNASEGSAKATDITDTQAVKADKRKAQRMYIQTVIISVIATALVIALPHL